MRRTGMAAIMAAILFAAVPLSHAASNEERRITQPIDIISTGGAGIASSGRIGMIFMNPASLGMGDQSDFSILKVGAMANYDLYDYYQLYNKLDTNAVDYGISQLSQSDLAKLLTLRAKIGVTGPLSLGYMGNGIGILLYDDMLTTFQVEQAPGLPYVNFGTYLDVGLIVGYGFQVPLPIFMGKFARLYMGVSVKYINRLKYENPRLDILEAFDMGMSILNAEKGLYLGQNIGADAGMTLELSESLAVAAVVRDFFSTGFSWSEYGYGTNLQKIDNGDIPMTYFYPAFDVGMAYTARWSSYILSGINFYFDIADSLDFSENYWLKLRLGAEATFLRILKLRAGLYEGYPTLGVGINIPLLKINAAYYTEELGTYPGENPQSTVMLDVELVI